jgi:hypothetical protein
MQFDVIFTGEGDRRASVYLNARSLGTIDVDKLREDNPDLPIESISCVVSELKQNVSFKLTEEQARAIPSFKRTGTVYVHGKDGFLNGFVKEKIYIDRDSVTQEVVEAGFIPCVDKEAILEAWTKDGFPANW